jgi:hypothetical protein
VQFCLSTPPTCSIRIAKDTGDKSFELAVEGSDDCDDNNIATKTAALLADVASRRGLTAAKCVVPQWGVLAADSGGGGWARGARRAKMRGPFGTVA